MLDNRHIYSFLRLAQNLHFGRTAEELNVSQPTLSAQIRALEEELGGALFIRTSRRVSLTPMGKTFQEDARRIMASVAIAERNAEFSLQGGNAHFSIGVCGGVVTAGILHSVFGVLSDGFPGAEIHCREMPPASLLEDLQAELFDIVISNTYGLNFPQDIESFSVGRTDISLVAHKDLELVTSSGNLKIADLRELTFLLYDSMTNYPSIVENMFGFVPKRIMRTPSLRVLMELVDTGFGVAVIPQIDTQLRGASTAVYNLTELVQPARTMEFRMLKRRQNSQLAVKRGFQLLKAALKKG